MVYIVNTILLRDERGAISLLSRECVIGSDGFIGSNLVRELLSAGKEVVGISSELALKDLFKNPPKDTVLRNLYWCASTLNPASAEKNPELVKVEVQKFEEYLGLLSKYYPRSRLIFLSSGGCTYSGSSNVYRESEIAFGVNEYGRMKIVLEEILTSAFPRSLCIRVGNAYGAGQPTGRGQGVIAEWLRTIKSNSEVTVFGGLESFRDYIHVDDLAKCLVSLGDIEYSGILNVSNGYPTSLAEIYDGFQDVWPMRILIKQFAQRDFDRTGYTLDNSKIRGLTNWQPQIEISAGIAKLIKN